MFSRTRTFWPIAFFTGFVGLDQLLKLYAYLYVPSLDSYAIQYPYGGIGLLQTALGIDLSLNYVANTGGAWGLFAEYPYHLLAVRLVLIIGFWVYLYWWRPERNTALSFFLILCGAVSNTVDFFTYGYVVDMICFHFWGYCYPVFNLADSYIFIGVAFLLILKFFSSGPQKMRKQPIMPMSDSTFYD